MAHFAQMTENLRAFLVIILCLFSTVSTMAFAATPEDKAAESLYYYNKIRALYPEDGNLPPYPEITEEYLSNLSLYKLRRLLVSIDKSNFSEEYVMMTFKIYKLKADELSSVRDMKIASMYQSYLENDNSINRTEFLLPYFQDKDWLVTFYAYHLKYIGELYSGERFSILDSLEQSALLIPSNTHPLFDEVQAIQTENTATVLSMTTNIDAAIQASEATIYFKEKAGMHIAYDSEISNLQQTHDAIYKDELSLKLAQELSQKTKYLDHAHGYALNLLGTSLLYSGRYQEALPHFKKSLELLTSPYWLSPTYAEIAQIYVEEGNLATAKKYLDKVADLKNTSYEAAAHSVAYQVALIKYFAKTGESIQFSEAVKDLELTTRRTRREMSAALGNQALFQYKKTSSYGININGEKYDFLPSGEGDQFAQQGSERLTSKLSDADRSKLDVLANLVFLNSANVHPERDRTNAIHAFMDTFLETNNPTIIRAINNKIKSDEEATSEILALIDAATTTLELPAESAADRTHSRYALFLEAFEKDTSLNTIAPYTEVYKNTIAAKFAVYDRDYKNAWGAIYAAETIMDHLPKGQQSARFELSTLKARLFANEQNHTKTLNAVVENIKTGLEQNRSINMDQLLSLAISSMHSSGLMAEALELAQIQMQVNSKSDTSVTFMGKFNKGMLLNETGEYKTAISYLKQSITPNSNTRQLTKVRRELFTAYAGLNDRKNAQTMRTSLNALLASFNDPYLVNSTNVYLALGDYRLADHSRAANSEELYKQWVTLKSSETEATRATVDQIIMNRTQALDERFIRNRQIATDMAASHNRTVILGLFAIGSLIAILIALSIFNLMYRRRANEAVAQAGEHQKSESIKSHFLYLINHQSQLTLDAISGYVDMIKKVHIPLQNEPTIEMIEANADKLSNDIGDYVVSSRILTGDKKLVVEPFDLRGYAQRKSDLVDKQIDSENVNFGIDIDIEMPAFSTDKMLLNAVLDKSIDLALNRTQFGFVKVNLSHHQSLNAHHLKINIEDTGPGLDDNLQEVSTDILSVTDDRIIPTGNSRDTALAIIWSAVKALGGTVSTSAKPGEGARIIANVPIELDKVQIHYFENDNKIVQLRK